MNIANVPQKTGDLVSITSREGIDLTVARSGMGALDLATIGPIQVTGQT
jgi:hypothetical protein